MNRTARLLELKTHPYYGPLIKKMGARSFQECIQFAEKHQALSVAEYEKQVNQFGLNVDPKPKHVGLMADLLLASNH